MAAVAECPECGMYSAVEPEQLYCSHCVASFPSGYVKLCHDASDARFKYLLHNFFWMVILFSFLGSIQLKLLVWLLNPSFSGLLVALGVTIAICVIFALVYCYYRASKKFPVPDPRA